MSTIQLLIVCLTAAYLAVVFRGARWDEPDRSAGPLLEVGERYALYLGGGEQQITGLVRSVVGGVAELSDAVVVTAGKLEPLGKGHARIPLDRVLMTQELDALRAVPDTGRRSATGT